MRSQSSDKENNSTNISKKLRFDVSLFKGVEFDDLVLDEKNPEDNYGNDYIDSAPNFESQILISEINIKDNACSNICLNTTINDEHFINMSKYRRNQCTSQKSSSKSVENKIIMSLLNKESSCTKNKSNAIAAKSNIPQSKLKETKKQRPISTVTDRSKPIHKVKVLLPTPSKAERLNKLYQKNKEKNTKLELRKKKQDEEKQLKELEACSFKPKLNKKFNDTHKASILQMSMYDRQVSWSNKKQDKINKDKHFNALQEKYECTFTPDVKKRTAEFDSIWRYDKTTKNYFRRIKNAKDLNEELKSKLNPDYSKRK